MSMTSPRGFTLIELILVIVLVGILAVVATVFILPPFQAAADIERRAALVDAADLAINRITREVRNALPNSLKVSPNQNQIEFIATVTSGRYRRLPGNGSDAAFIPAKSEGTFDVLGGLVGWGNVSPFSAAAPGTACGTNGGDCLSVYNTGQPELNAWEGQNLAPITKAEETSITYETTDSPPFKTHSPQQRFHIIGETVEYECSNGKLLRRSGYGLSGNSNSVAAYLVAENIDQCKFEYKQENSPKGTATRRGLLTIRLDLEDEGESIFLLGQAQVLNTP